jgi:hypothetical protein
MLFADLLARDEAFHAYGKVSEATMKRSRGWAILFGAVLLDTGLTDNMKNAAIGEGILRRTVL